GLPAGACADAWNLSHPDLVGQICPLLPALEAGLRVAIFLDSLLEGSPTQVRKDAPAPRTTRARPGGRQAVVPAGRPETAPTAAAPACPGRRARLLLVEPRPVGAGARLVVTLPDQRSARLPVRCQRLDDLAVHPPRVALAGDPGPADHAVARS